MNANNMVRAAGFEAEVVSSTRTEILARVPSFPAGFNPANTVAGYIAGSGLRYTRYDLSSAGINDCERLRT